MMGYQTDLVQILRLSKDWENKVQCIQLNNTDDLGDWTASLAIFANVPRVGTVTKLSDNKKNNHPKH